MPFIVDDILAGAAALSGGIAGGASAFSAVSSIFAGDDQASGGPLRGAKLQWATDARSKTEAVAKGEAMLAAVGTVPPGEYRVVSSGGLISAARSALQALGLSPGEVEQEIGGVTSATSYVAGRVPGFGGRIPMELVPAVALLARNVAPDKVAAIVARVMPDGVVRIGGAAPTAAATGTGNIVGGMSPMLWVGLAAVVAFVIFFSARK